MSDADIRRLARAAATDATDELAEWRRRVAYLREGRHDEALPFRVGDVVEIRWVSIFGSQARAGIYIVHTNWRPSNDGKSEHCGVRHRNKRLWRRYLSNTQEVAGGCGAAGKRTSPPVYWNRRRPIWQAPPASPSWSGRSRVRKRPTPHAPCR